MVGESVEDSFTGAIKYNLYRKSRGLCRGYEQKYKPGRNRVYKNKMD